MLTAWWRILNGRAPMLSIEITRECPLSCPGCYAYGETHLGGQVTLRDLHDLHGDDLVNGVLSLVRKHRPMHVSLVGGSRLNELVAEFPENPLFASELAKLNVSPAATVPPQS